MQFDRRQLLGAFAVAGTGLLGPHPKPSAAQLVAPLPTPGAVPATPIAAARPPLLARALASLDSHSSRVSDRSVIGLVDFAAPSHATRLHIVDVASGRVLEQHLVAHGHGSDPDNSGWVETFSNRPGSNASSQGAFLAADLYTGQHGRSRRLVGLDPENNLALERAIVIHAASYVDATMARTQNRVGRSQGCFAVSSQSIGDVLWRLAPGRMLYAGKLA